MVNKPPLPAMAVAQALGSAQRILITSHRSPDGDALGSELALWEACSQLGKQAWVVNRDPHPPSLSFLPHLERILVVDQVPAWLLEQTDLVVFLECPGSDRPGFPELLTKPLVNVDHHLDNPQYGAVNYLDPQAPAVGEMLLAVVDAAGVRLSPSMATCLYTALVTDTGDFRYANTTARAFAAAQRLVEAGAQPAVIAEALNDHVPERVVRLQAMVLATLEMLAQGRVAVITCTAEMLKQAQAQPQDTEDMVNLPRAIDGVRVAVFFKAFTPGAVRVSLRSKGSINVQALAATFGGGGHENAAGLTFVGSLEQARAHLLPKVCQLVESA
ncbi:MAG: bifunctional oligoribonuclease/PAP phosphatase NrnA [Thermoanaerobaculum sp.]|nr:bifunctional oligoribonuclease/PAP phosphatase NrnA [Thermoanaerobaculum sp.]